MECLYKNDLSAKDTLITLDIGESKHIRSLRLKPNDLIEITNGRGLKILAKLLDYNINHSSLQNLKLLTEMPVNLSKISIAIPYLDNKDRMEMIIEKAVEFQINSIFLYKSKFSQVQKMKPERIDNKAISALKQCKGVFLPEIYFDKNLYDILDLEWENRILLDIFGENPIKISKKFQKSIIFVGPEGGFSKEEIEMISSKNEKSSVQTWKLSEFRLRAETAAIASIVLANNLSYC